MLQYAIITLPLERRDEWARVAKRRLTKVGALTCLIFPW